VKAKIVRVGNSKGIRLPKPLIEQAGLAEDVELEAREGEIVISSATKSRRGWAEAAIALATRGEDRLLDEPSPTIFDDEEWTW